MALIILHTGQSGVERGADRAARSVGFAVEGFSTYERRDELGALPPEIATDLVRCETRGARSALRSTLERADVLVIAVPDSRDANANTGVEALRRNARAAGVPHWLVDPAGDLEALAVRLRALEATTDPLRILVTGPRFTRWREGERLGWRVVAQLSLEHPLVAPAKQRIVVVDDGEEGVETDRDAAIAPGHDRRPRESARPSPNLGVIRGSLADADAALPLRKSG